MENEKPHSNEGTNRIRYPQLTHARFKNQPHTSMHFDTLKVLVLHLRHGENKVDKTPQKVKTSPFEIGKNYTASSFL